jgi:hypothetical protein
MSNLLGLSEEDKKKILDKHKNEIKKMNVKREEDKKGLKIPEVKKPS